MGKSKHRGYPVTLVMVSCLGGLTFLAVMALLWASFQIAERNTIELTKENAGMTLDAIEARISAQLEPVKVLVDELTEMIADHRVGDNSPEEMEEALRAALAATPQISVLAFITPKLDMVSIRRNAPGMPAKHANEADDPEIVEVLAKAESADKPFWGGLYYAEAAEATFMNFYAPVRRGSTFLGFLLVGISTREFSAFLSDLSDLETANFISAFVLYDRESVLAHPLLSEGYPGLSDVEPLASVAKFADPILQNIWQAERTFAADPDYLANFEAHGLELGDNDYIFIYREVATTTGAPWIIGSYFLLEDVASQARRLGLLPWIAAVIMVLAFIIAVVLGRALGRPTRRLADAAQRIKEFDLEAVPALPHGQMLEMNQAVDAFDSMVSGLKSFETYVPRSLVRNLIAQHGAAGVPSEERELTVLFTDIVGFTSRTENLAAQEVAAFLNEHFSLIGSCVLAEGGTIDKYIGDALMAFWGAPVQAPDTAAAACRAALAMRTAIETDNDRRAAAGLARVGIRVGIHTGPVVVGNIGLKGRINYTVVGDTVNSCQRLESLGKEAAPVGSGDVTILISAATKTRIGPEFETALLGHYAVKGREESLEVHALLSGPTTNSN